MLAKKTVFRSVFIIDKLIGGYQFCFDLGIVVNRNRTTKH